MLVMYLRVRVSMLVMYLLAKVSILVMYLCVSGIDCGCIFVC